MGEAISFYFLAGIITILSICVITIKKPVVAVTLLVFNLFFLAGVYALLGADFVAIIQIIIYAGAILVLFMFVIMILDPNTELVPSGNKLKKLAAFTSLTTGFLLFAYKMFISTASFQAFKTPLIKIETDNTYEIGLKLFEKYLWPFEIASILILLAIVASISISRKPPQTKKA